MDAQGTVYVYGILLAAERNAVSALGVTGAAVRTVERAGLAALVSDLEEETLTPARELRAHWRVMQAASQNATVLPVRFGTVMANDRSVTEELLEPQAERLSARLRELAGRVQLSVKGEYDEAALLREVVHATPAVKALRERVGNLPDAAGYYDRIRLGEFVSAEVERRRASDAALAVERLSAHAVATETSDPKTPSGAFDLAFLVERDGVDTFSAAVGDLAAMLEERVAIRYVGPLPPYSFADDEVRAGEAAWA